MTNPQKRNTVNPEQQSGAASSTMTIAVNPPQSDEKSSNEKYHNSSFRILSRQIINKLMEI